MKKNKRIKLLMLTVIMILTLYVATGCIPGDGKYTNDDPAGFFWGIWHGCIAPISLIISIFKEGIRIYEPINTGFWYDFGFYMAVAGGIGGISSSSKKKKKDN